MLLRKQAIIFPYFSTSPN